MMLSSMALVGQVALAQQARSFTFDIPAAVADAAPLFGPVREREWAPEWVPIFVNPDVPTQREGVVFTTATHGGATRLWVLTDYDPQEGRVAYVVVDDGFLVTNIKIAIVVTGARTSRATVTYRRVALTERANQQVNALTAEWAAEQAHHWGTAITAALAR